MSDERKIYETNVHSKEEQQAKNRQFCDKVETNFKENSIISQALNATRTVI